MGTQGALSKPNTERASAEGPRCRGGRAPMNLDGMKLESGVLATRSRSRAGRGKGR